VPKVSIVMPTFNRADTILRAISSAQSQTLTDWELIIIDDGSTDNTAALIPSDDARIKVHRQANAGFVAARNAGMQRAIGDYIAFLDSDDELLPFHLELGTSYLDAFPAEQFVTSEGREDFGHGRYLYHYRVETSEWYPRMAASIGCRSFDLPPGETDDYMRCWQIREPVGAWGSKILDAAGITAPRYLYKGKIFQHLRWGFIMSVNSMIARRSALESVGYLDPRYGLAGDQELVCKLALRHNSNFFGIPTYIKHEYTPAGTIPAVTHLATGRTALRFYRDMLKFFDDYFMVPNPDDQELRAIRSLMLLDTAQVALRAGQRDEGLDLLAQTRAGLPRFGRAISLSLLAHCLPSARTSESLWRRSYRMVDRVNNLFRKRVQVRSAPQA
jgi:Glycosyl transferase family 2